MAKISFENIVTNDSHLIIYGLNLMVSKMVIYEFIETKFLM